MRTIETASAAGRTARGRKRPVIELDRETLGNIMEERRQSLAAKGRVVGPVTARDRLIRAKLRAAAQRVGPGVATAAGL